MPLPATPSAPIPAELSSALGALVTRPQLLVATDFDGVLAPLVHDPMASRPLPGSIDLLRQLARLAGVTAAVVSGRDLATLSQLTGLTPAEPVVLIGSHGAEASVDLGLDAAVDAEAAARLSAAHEIVRAILAAHPQVRVEHKPAGVVLHTRGVDRPQAEAATTAMLQAFSDRAGYHPMRGKEVVELSVVDVSKGVALQALSQEATLYLGDDVTDEKAFAMLPADAGHVTVKVGAGETLAAHRVPDPQAAVAVLRDVLTRRT